MTARPRGAYGIDAPWVPVLWVGIAAATSGIAILFGLWRGSWWTDALCWYFGACTGIYLIGAALYWYASLRGKFLIWQDLLDRIPSNAVTNALDLGCGRGAVAIATALRFPEARVTGIDLWRTVDQSGNGEDAARDNAHANGVHSRLALVTGDMTALPFEDGVFDLITAGLSIHNVPTEDGRTAALREAVRVLTPRGQLIIVDIRRTRDYAEQLTQLGLTVSGPNGLGWRSWWTGPWMAAIELEATQT